MAELRNYKTLMNKEDSFPREFIWQNGYFKLIYATETLLAEETITEATAGLLMQIAYGFKACLEALDELTKKENE